MLGACSGGNTSYSSVNSNQGLRASLVALKTSGVAPLAVFLDATSSADPVKTSRPFHDLDYSWALEAWMAARHGVMDLKWVLRLAVHSSMGAVTMRRAHSLLMFMNLRAHIQQP